MAIDLNQPQVMAAIVGGSVAAVVSLIVAAVNQLSLRSMHRQKLDFDRDLAERRVNAEIALADRKITADIALAEKKFAFDKAMVSWRRRFDIAEQVLAAAYEARDALNWARTRVIFSGEGRTRVVTEPESDKIREARDQAFIPIERLTEHAKAFAALQTVQDAVAAHLGPQVVQPIIEILKAHRSIMSASHHLIRYASWNEDPTAAEGLRPFRDEIWGDRPDDKDRKVDAAIEQLDAICKPILSAEAPA